MSYQPNRVAGEGYTYVDGVALPLGGKLTVSGWTSEKETKTGLSGVVGYSEKPRAPFIEIEVITDGTLDLQAFQSVRDSTITAELANGQTFIMRNAWCTSPPDMDAADGTATLRFEGKQMERA